MSIPGLIVGRVLSALLTLLLVSLLIFSVLEILPGDVATRVLGRDATPEALAVLRERLNLDDPAHIRYLTWLGSIAQGDLGNSLISGRRVADILGPRIFNTRIASPRTEASNQSYRRHFRKRSIDVATIVSKATVAGTAT